MQKILPTLALALISAPLLHAAELHVKITDHKGKPVADAVILAVPTDAKITQRGKVPADAIDQVDKQFVPYVKPIPVGATLHFPNSDNIRHQVYSFSPAKKFELPLYAGTDAPPVVFDKPGVVVLGCNIHDWMIGYIYVSDTPFFAKTGAAGTATLNDMPAGEYTVRVWHPNMERTEESTAQRVSVAPDSPASAEWRIELKPAIRVPRVSGASSPAYP